MKDEIFFFARERARARGGHDGGAPRSVLPPYLLQRAARRSSAAEKTVCGISTLPMATSVLFMGDRCSRERCPTEGHTPTGQREERWQQRWKRGVCIDLKQHREGNPDNNALSPIWLQRREHGTLSRWKSRGRHERERGEAAVHHDDTIDRVCNYSSSTARR